MRIKILLGILIVSCSGAAFAKNDTNDKLDRLHNDIALLSSQIETLPNKKAEPNPFLGCYLDNKLYTKGAVVNNRICHYKDNIDMSGVNKANEFEWMQYQPTPYEKN